LTRGLAVSACRPRVTEHQHQKRVKQVFQRNHIFITAGAGPNRVIRSSAVMLLSDKFTVERGSVYLTGIQALVRLPMDQMRRDRRAGLKTGTFISGYEGSPLGGYDLALARSKKLLDEHGIHFHP